MSSMSAVSARRPFRFGVQLLHPGPRDDFASLVRRAETLGYSTISMSDHFGSQWGPLPGLAAAAVLTQGVRLGTWVLANDFRHPVVVAKDVATIDQLSGGRVEIGIGGGWMNAEYRQAGIPFDAAAVRIERLTEAVAVLKGLWRDGPLTFHGRHYRIDGLEGLPKPVQRPGVRLAIGGGGRRILELAGREADIVGINWSLASGSMSRAARTFGVVDDELNRRLGWVRAAAGPRFSHIELALRVIMVAVTDDRVAAVERLADEYDIPPDVVNTVPYALVGTVDEIGAQLADWRERYGFSFVVISQTSMESFAPVVAQLTGR